MEDCVLCQTVCYGGIEEGKRLETAIKIYAWMQIGLAGAWCVYNAGSLLRLLVTGKASGKICYMARLAPPFCFLLFFLLTGEVSLLSILLLILALNTLCVILTLKFSERVRWSELMICFFTVFQWLRKKLGKIREKLSRGKTKGVILAVVLAAALFLTLVSAKTATFFVMFVIFMGALFMGTGSVRYLLLFWMLSFGAMLGYGFIVAAELIYSAAASSFIGIFVLTAGTTILWCVSIGVADHDVGKLAAGIINTMTTCVLIVLSVLGAYDALGEGSWISDQLGKMLQLVALNGVLPFVIAGYIAALFKEMQIYVEKKYIPEDYLKKACKP